MFRMDNWFLKGWVYFLVMFALIPILPPWTGRENGIIEDLQLLWLLAGMVYCGYMLRTKQLDWGGSPARLWSAGIIYFFLLFMREISWGRVFFTNDQGGVASYQQLGLYGKLVHPLVATLIAIALVLVVQAKIWRLIKLIKLPLKSFLLLPALAFIYSSLLARGARHYSLAAQPGYGGASRIWCLYDDVLYYARFRRPSHAKE